MAWNPLAIIELPAFVYSIHRPATDPRTASAGRPAPSRVVVAGKTGFVCSQRMETPVIYFYSPKAMYVNAAVDFPAGQMTEWYPKAASGARIESYASQHGLATKPAIVWENVRLLPQNGAGAPVSASMPVDSGGSHYFAARQTESDYVELAGAKGNVEMEKFLFHRGAGDFDAPLKVKLIGDKSEDV